MTWALPRMRLGILIVAAVALMGCALIGFRAPQEAARSYLAAYLFFLGPPLGSLALLMVHTLTGGEWGFDLRPALFAATRILPLLALLLLPLLFSVRWLYPWAVAAQVSTTRLLEPQQGWYLNLPFFLSRAVVCFAFWIWGAGIYRSRLIESRTAVPSWLAATGLIVYIVTITIATVDWVMSLVPAWHSQIVGLIVGVGQILCAAALATLCAAKTGKGPIRDLGSLLLMLVLAWSYLVFMDFLTAWSADLPSETVWYLPRLKTNWRWWGLCVVTLNLLLPFSLLLSHNAKQNYAWLRAVAILLLLAQATFAVWLVMPSVSPTGFSLRWSDALAWVGIGGVCWVTFDAALARARVEVRILE